MTTPISMERPGRPLPTSLFLLNGLIWGSWFWLYRPTLTYLAHIFSRDYFRTNLILLVAIIGLILYRNRGELHRIDWGKAPQIRVVPAVTVLSSVIAYLWIERFVDINTLSGVVFGIGTYGLIGLWMASSRWWRGIPAACLLIGVLPFGAHLETFIGYPLRIATADIVRTVLATAGVASVGTDTILVFETGISHVDLPCSGVKSLWTGALFWFAATWIEEKGLNLHWLLAAAVFALVLVLTNIIRVAILVTTGEVMGLRLFAEMLHVPLGVFGFVAACFIALLMIRALPTRSTVTESATHVAPTPAWGSAVWILIFIAAAWIYTPRPETGLSTRFAGSIDFPIPAAIHPVAEPLTPDESNWLTRDGADAAERYRFEWNGHAGTMILISSRTWRAHHRPERCFEVYGLDLHSSVTAVVRPDLPVRSVILADPNSERTYQSVYWFQSAERTTDDYSARIWADVHAPGTEWVLVSILLDNEVAQSDLDQLIEMIHTGLDGRDDALG